MRDWERPKGSQNLIYTVISDIHSNLPALEEFLIHYRRDTKILCLGDVIGYGGSPQQSLDIIRSLTDIIISGNHERMLVDPSIRRYASYHALTAIEWTEKVLKREAMTFIKRLPVQYTIEDKILLIHGSPNDPDEYVFTSEIALNSIYRLEEMRLQIALIGHTHLPGIFNERGLYFYRENTTVQLDAGKRYLINPGSIGQPRDRDPRLSFCEIDTGQLTVTFHRYDYDIQRAADEILKHQLPEHLAFRLFRGV